ncbi:MAG TPA: hypothetical protein VEB64_12150 [Azospirillaceae bacterium]|nr:hypothetical protein [Azospirillaceae bacterium]
MRFFHFLALLVLPTGLSGCADVLAAKALAPATFGMERIADHLYVDSAMSPAQREEVAALLPEARARVAAYYGEVTSTPDMIACSTQECFDVFGGGRRRALAVGWRALVLSPRALTPPMLAHEWSHTELHARVSSLFALSLPVPAWFDEGLAVMISDDPAHSEEIWQEVERRSLPRPDLASLTTLSAWNAAVVRYGDAQWAEGSGTPQILYPLAGHAVRGWYARAGREGLLALIRRVREGEDFDAVHAGEPG